MQDQATLSLKTDHTTQRLPFAVKSLILGFLSCTIFGIISGIPAVIYGHKALSKYKRDPKTYVTGKRIALSGLILGYTGIVLSIALFVGMLMIYCDWGPYKPL